MPTALVPKGASHVPCESRAQDAKIEATPAVHVGIQCTRVVGLCADEKRVTTDKTRGRCGDCNLL